MGQVSTSGLNALAFSDIIALYVEQPTTLARKGSPEERVELVPIGVYATKHAPRQERAPVQFLL